jgi:hypothetical protein
MKNQSKRKGVVAGKLALPYHYSNTAPCLSSNPVLYQRRLMLPEHSSYRRHSWNIESFLIRYSSPFSSYSSLTSAQPMPHLSPPPSPHSRMYFACSLFSRQQRAVKSSPIETRLPSDVNQFYQVQGACSLGKMVETRKEARHRQHSHPYVFRQYSDRQAVVGGSYEVRVAHQSRRGPGTVPCSLQPGALTCRP